MKIYIIVCVFTLFVKINLTLVLVLIQAYEIMCLHGWSVKIHHIASDVRSEKNHYG